MPPKQYSPARKRHQAGGLPAFRTVHLRLDFPPAHPCLSVSIRGEFVKALCSLELARPVDSHCQ